MISFRRPPDFTPSAGEASTRAGRQSIKCVVWDLDNTLWNGVLLEDGHVSLRAGVVDIIKTLDSRGILNSIASKKNSLLRRK